MDVKMRLIAKLAKTISAYNQGFTLVVLYTYFPKLQNIIVAEFDRYMEEHKRELTEKNPEDSMDIDQYDTQQADLERADQQVTLTHSHRHIDTYPLTLYRQDSALIPFNPV